MEEDTFYSTLYEYTQSRGAHKWFIEKTHSELEKGFIGPPHEHPKILELGGNIGEHVKYVNQNYLDYTLSDYRNTYPTNLPSRVSFCVIDAHQIPFESNFFDRVIITCLLHHVLDVERVLLEARRVTKKAGIISIMLPCDPGILYRILKKLGVKRIWRQKGVENPEYFHYKQHRNHFPGILSIILEVFKSDERTVRYWPFKIKSWNLNAFTIIEMRINGKE